MNLLQHSKDSAGEWDLQDRQKLSSLQYVCRIIQARRATLGPQEGTLFLISFNEKRLLSFNYANIYYILVGKSLLLYSFWLWVQSIEEIFLNKISPI